MDILTTLLCISFTYVSSGSCCRDYLLDIAQHCGDVSVLSIQLAYTYWVDYVHSELLPLKCIVYMLVVVLLRVRLHVWKGVRRQVLHFSKLL